MTTQQRSKRLGYRKFAAACCRCRIRSSNPQSWPRSQRDHGLHQHRRKTNVVVPLAGPTVQGSVEEVEAEDTMDNFSAILSALEEAVSYATNPVSGRTNPANNGGLMCLYSYSSTSERGSQMIRSLVATLCSHSNLPVLVSSPDDRR